MPMECTTLWNNQGNSDKVYQVIVSPHEEGNERTWDVYARYGRRNGTLQLDVKAEGVNLPIAQAMARNLIHSKRNRGYRVSPDAARVPEENLLRIQRLEMNARRAAPPQQIQAAPPPVQVAQAPLVHPPVDVGGLQEKPAMRPLQNHAVFQGLENTNWPLREDGTFPIRLDGIPVPQLMGTKDRVDDIADKENYALSTDWWVTNYYACVNGKAMAWDMWGNPTIMFPETADFLKRVEKATGPIAFLGDIRNFPFRETPVVYIMSWKVFGGKDLRNLNLREAKNLNPYLREAIRIAENANNRIAVEMSAHNNVMGDRAWRSMSVRSPKKHESSALIIFDKFGNPLAIRSPMTGRRIEDLNIRMG